MMHHGWHSLSLLYPFSRPGRKRPWCSFREIFVLIQIEAFANFSSRTWLWYCRGHLGLVPQIGSRNQMSCHCLWIACQSAILELQITPYACFSNHFLQNLHTSDSTFLIGKRTIIKGIRYPPLYHSNLVIHWIEKYTFPSKFRFLKESLLSRDRSRGSKTNKFDPRTKKFDPQTIGSIHG